MVPLSGIADRDQFIGWPARLRQERLAFITNQQRFLILPWVRAPHLACHLLALALGILCGVGRRTLTRAIDFQGAGWGKFFARHSGAL